MPVPSTPHDSQSVIVVIVIIAGLCVVYWRLALRLLVILMVALAVYGAFETLHL